MAVLVRTNQSIVCCHRSDPNTVGGVATPDPEWVLADGQPPEATRFKVRPLNPDEFHTTQSADNSEARSKYVCSVALLAVDGEPVDELGYGWAQEVCNLVVAITTDPLSARVLRLMGASSAATKDSE